MTRRILALAILTAAWAAPAGAQTLGTFRFQLQPYCNVVAVTIVQQGAQYLLDGTDDQCGTGPRAAVSGLAFLNPSGLLGFGFTIVTAPGGTPVHVDADLNLGTLSGTWRDSAGNTGTFPLLFGASTGGSPRPSPAVGDITGVTAGAGLTGGGASGAVSMAVDFAATQQRVTGTCPSGQLMTGVNQNGTVACQSASGSGGGDITSVVAGAGLTGGASTGDAALAVSFSGTGITSNAARADHWHQLGGYQNVGTGNSVLVNNSGSRNTALGFQAITMGVGNGDDNTAVGNQALHLNTSGSSNSAVGSVALFSNTTGASNTAVGRSSLQFNTTGSENTALGTEALALNTTAGLNAAVGTRALYSNTSGVRNSALGAWALLKTTTGGYNVAAGTAALFNNTTGGGNTAIGAEAMVSNVAGEKSTAIGEKAMYFATGSFNTAAGNRAMVALTSGTNNVAVGYNALPDNQVGQSNVAIGANAGVGATGFNNIFLGTDVAGVAAQSNTIRIGNGAAAATFITGISGTTSAGGVGVFVNANGQLGTLTSSRRFKDDIASLGETFSARVQALRPVSFVYQPAFDDGTKQAQYGLIAEEVAEIFPELVVRNVDGSVQTVRYHFLAPLLLAEVQRLERERATLTATLAAQSEELAKLRTQMDSVLVITARDRRH
jgi:trimeric autotransporter adhesin